MKEDIQIAFKALYSFVKSPFAKPIIGANTNRELVWIATIIYAIPTLLQLIFENNIDHDAITIAIRLIMIPIVARVIVYFYGAIFHYYLKWIASRIIKTNLNNIIYAKQIMVFSSIGIMLRFIPDLSSVSILIVAIIEFVGLLRLYELNITKSVLVVIIYEGLIWLILYGLIQLTKLF